MKTSNKLLTLLVSLIFVFTTAGFIDIRIFGKHRSEDKTPKKTINQPIGTYKYLKVENLSYLEIKPSGYNHFSLTIYNDTTEWGMTYEIVNDTLKIVGRDIVNKSYSYWLYTQSNIEAILVKDSRVELSGLNFDQLDIDITNGEVNNYRNELTVNNLSIRQLNSRAQLNNSKVDTLSIEMEGSYARFNQNLKSVTAKLSQESELSLKNLSDIQMQKDEKSRLSLY